MSNANPSIAPPALRVIGWPDDEAARQAWAQRGDARIARVVAQHRNAFEVAEGPEPPIRVQAPPAWLRPRSDPEARACVGDWVLLDPQGREIRSLLPRRSLLKRAAAGERYRAQPIAANIDCVLVVCGLDGDYNPRRIERYLLLVGGSGAQPVVVLTKADRHPAAAALAEVAALAGGAPVHAVNAKDPESLTALHPYLGPGRTVVLVGSSGAGKSTLTNTLLGTEKMRTAAVREHDSRGRHTTTSRVLMPLPQGGCLIDTPGMRELKLTGEEHLDESFEDIAQLAEQCRFRDCRHHAEPGCAVRAACAAGQIDPARLDSYLKLQEERAEAAETLAQRLADKAEARVLNKALRKRLVDKYGRDR